MKSQAVTTYESVKRALDAVRHEAGVQVVDQVTALTWLAKAAEAAASTLKKQVRHQALLELTGQSSRVAMTGALGTAQVSFQAPSVKLKGDADLSLLKKALGDRFSDLFVTVPESVEPVKNFKQALEDFDGPPEVIDLVETSVTYSERAARVQPPRAPKV